jgi:2-oxoglutarate/2-oxoacid ferredoxin oxidoreductase subunit alpha
MAVGAAHTGVRAMCATSGGGFALMTEALGAAAMMEVPVVCINVQRAGPATGVPTKTEQGDLWQALGAGQGDYPRIIVAPTTVEDCFHIVPELFNLVDKFQCPGIILSDLLLSEGRFSIDPAELDFNVPIDRGALIGLNGTNGHSPNGAYRRYELTPSGVSPRAIPGTEGYVHVVATDEHDEDGVLISDEFTNPLKRRAMHEKRMRKMESVLEHLEAPKLFGPEDAEVTLIGWGSTTGVIREAMQQLAAEGITANNLQVKWLVPLHVDAIGEIVAGAKRTIIVENNYSGQFARYLRSETSIVADGHIRKYDGEPFMPHHIVAGVKAVLAGAARQYVPAHEIMV